jgi:hypothetical protein
MLCALGMTNYELRVTGNCTFELVLLGYYGKCVLAFYDYNSGGSNKIGTFTANYYKLV